MAALSTMSTSGVLARSVTLPVPIQIRVRCVIAALVLYLVLKLQKKKVALPGRRFGWQIVVASILMGLHWIFYFYALFFSNVAIGMLSLFTYTIFTALLEPVVLKTKFQLRHIPLTLIGMLGLYLLIPSEEVDNDYGLGIVCGVISALAYTFRNLSMKQSIATVDGVSLMFFQMLILSIVMFGTVFFYPADVLIIGFANNWELILVLGIVTSALGHTLFVSSLAYFSTTALSILSNLIPIFGIAMGYFFLSESPQAKILIGGALILMTSFIEGYFSWMKSEK